VPLPLQHRGGEQSAPPPDLGLFLRVERTVRKIQLLERFLGRRPWLSDNGAAFRSRDAVKTVKSSVANAARRGASDELIVAVSSANVG